MSESGDRDKIQRNQSDIEKLETKALELERCFREKITKMERENRQSLDDLRGEYGQKVSLVEDRCAKLEAVFERWKNTVKAAMWVVLFIGSVYNYLDSKGWIQVMFSPSASGQ